VVPAQQRGRSGGVEPYRRRRGSVLHSGDGATADDSAPAVGGGDDDIEPHGARDVAQSRAGDGVGERDRQLPGQAGPDGVTGRDDAGGIGRARHRLAGVRELALLDDLDGAGLGRRGGRRPEDRASGGGEDRHRTRSEGDLPRACPGRQREGSGTPTAHGATRVAPTGATGGGDDGGCGACGEGDGPRRAEGIEDPPAVRDVDEQAAEDLALRRSVLVKPVVAVALGHETVGVAGDDAVQNDRVERRTAVGDDVPDGVTSRRAQDRQVPGVDPGLHAVAVRGDVRRPTAECGGPEQPGSRQHQRSDGADAGGSGGGGHRGATRPAEGRTGVSRPPSHRRCRTRRTDGSSPWCRTP
jgi:hypothetical protein